MSLPNPEGTIALLRVSLTRKSMAPAVVNALVVQDAIKLLEAAYPLPSCSPPPAASLDQSGFDGSNAHA
jgi:hypothetical protein